MVTARVRYASLSHRRLPETHAIAIFVWLALFYGCVFFLGGGSPCTYSVAGAILRSASILACHFLVAGTAMWWFHELQ